MRALVLAEHGRLVVEERSAPRGGPGDVLIRIAAVGICGSDIHGYSGETGRRVPGQVMGHEAAGRVEWADPATTGDELLPGRAVTFNPLISCGLCPACERGEEQHCPSRRVVGVDASITAAFADLLVMPRENVFALDDHVPIEIGALIEPLAVAFHAVRRSPLAPGDEVLIIGGGPIGQSLVLAAFHHGATSVVVSEPDPSRRELCERLGATVVDPLATSLGSVLSARATGPIAVVFDAVGTARSLADALGVSEPGATIALVGMGAQRVEIEAYALSTAERTLIGCFCYSRADFSRAVGWVNENSAGLEVLITRQIPLEEAPSAFAELAAGGSVPGKVIVRLDSPA